VPLPWNRALSSIVFPALAWSARPDGSLNFLNQRFQDFTGFIADQLHKLQWKSIVNQDDIQRLEVWWQELRLSEQAGRAVVRLHRFDGEYRWFQIAAAPILDPQANLVCWYGINIDIDDLKRSELKLREEGTDLRTITDAIRQVIVVLAPDGTTLASLRSPGSRRCYERAIAEFISWYCSEPRLGFNKLVVTRYRVQLESRRFGTGNDQSEACC
jgi:PAS domain S-box-containing protein